MQIKIKYFDKDLERIKILPNGDWIDLRSVETISLKKNEFKLIPLGIAVELPVGFEAYIAPRSSTFKNFGIIQANHLGIVDNTYNGDNDQWLFAAIALRDTTIYKNDRICQFRIVKKQPLFELIEVETLNNPDRGGFGSTGIK